MAASSDRRWIVLVRGVNVGKNKRLAMADLRRVLEALGYEGVRTHLNSGNALITTGKTTATKLEQDIATRLQADVGMDVKILVRSAEEWASAIDANPFAAEGADPKQLQAAFLARQPPAAKVRALDPDAYLPDRFHLGDRVVYVHMPNGYMGSKLPNWEKELEVEATVRTWNVVTRLAELVELAGAG